MSYQAYLDAIEAKSGKTPRQLLELAAQRGYGPTTKAPEVVTWLEDDYGIGRGHAMAFYGVLKNGFSISDKHVGSAGSHRDASTDLDLDGVAGRSASTD